MIDRLPGTTVELRVDHPQVSKDFLNNLFACGGLMLSQVSGLTGLEPHVIQNWVKRAFLPPPKKKMYSKRQFCRIAIINTLRESLQIDKIIGLLSYINGHLDDESDDMIDDTALYNYYVALLVGLDPANPTAGPLQVKIEQAIADYREPISGGRRRLAKVLEVMVYAHCASILRGRAESLMNEFDEN